MAFSLLWKNDEAVSKLDEAVFSDLKITKLLECCFDNYSDVDEMQEIMKLIPSKETLLYRQGIFEDLLNDKDGLLENLYYRLTDLVGRFISLREATENIKRRIFLIMYIYHYYQFLTITKDVLIKLNVKSKGLTDLIVKIDSIFDDNEVKNLRNEVKNLYDYITSHFEFNAEFHEGAPYYKITFDKKTNLEDELLDIAKGLNIELVKTPRQIMKKEVNPYFLYEISLQDKTTYEKIAEFYESNHQKVTDLSSLVSEFKYLLSLKTMFTKVNKQGIPFCKVLVNEENETLITDAYDVSLIVSKIDVIPNDFYIDGKENISFVLGVNSGGKTCYLRSIGANYVYFMTCGYMFAKSAKVYPVKYISTHFPNEENYSFGEGRLRDEIKRLDIIKSHFGPDSIAFLNETFSSTSEEKACVYTKQLLNDIGTTQAKVMYVTHQYKIFEEIHDSRIGFFTPVVMEGKSNIRTHKIKKVEKQLLSYVDDILYKHGLTKQQLLERKKGNE